MTELWDGWLSRVPKGEASEAPGQHPSPVPEGTLRGIDQADGDRGHCPPARFSLDEVKRIGILYRIFCLGFTPQVAPLIPYIQHQVVPFRHQLGAFG